MASNKSFKGLLMGEVMMGEVAESVPDRGLGVI